MEESKRKIKEGVVVPSKMQKTVKVKVERTFSHPRYKKVLRKGKHYYAHFEGEEIVVGSRVRIQETRPLSKLKRWIVTKVL